MKAPYREVVEIVKKSIDWSDMVIQEVKKAMGGGKKPGPGAMKH